MISYLEGKIAELDPTYVIIDVQGVGYQAYISLNTFSKLKQKEKTKLITHLHVREDLQVLYGFNDQSEKSLFLLLISVSGIGPNTAIVMLSSLSVAEVKNAIVTNDVKKIQSVKGIGAKTAQRTILELKDKILKHESSEQTSDISSFSNNNMRGEALSALITLGINKSMAEKNVATVLKTHGDNITLEELIKLSLKS
ncbi:MAG: Holliday junction branch migration protein RuvA [Bacteroidota bacterium]